MKKRKKFDTQTIVIYGLLALFVLYCIVVYNYRINADKRYALGYAYETTSSHAYPLLKIKYKINNKGYTTDTKGKENIHKFFIVECVENAVWIGTVEIKIPIDPNLLEEQPYGGWEECPINENGSIKKKYRRRDSQGNIINPESTGIAGEAPPYFDPIIALLILALVIGLVIIYTISYNKKWKNSRKYYVLARVNSYFADKYYYTLRGKEYSTEQGGDLVDKAYYIAEVMREDYEESRIRIFKRVKPNQLEPQPPEGWEDECPINDDGSIKEKFKRKTE